MYITKAILALFALATGAAAVVTPFANTVINPCNGETVTLNGRINTIITNNVFHINTINVKGTGDQGNQYVVNQHLQLATNTSPGSSTTTSELNLNVIGLGSTPNFLVHTLTHFTFTNNGVGSNVFVTSAECVGGTV